MSNFLPPFEQIAAIVPQYSTQGHGTTIISTTGLSSNTQSSVKTIIKRLARSRSTDLTALKARSSGATQRAILQPLPLAPGLVLVPLKIRKPIVRGDISTGYVNIHAVKAVSINQKRPFRSTLSLSGGTELPVMWTASTVKKQLQCARLVMTQTPSNHTLQETPASYAAISNIAAKLIEVIYDILTLKSKS
ncbi:hypothetical protein [Dendrosporobacter sp. 1207_IL3150]|uniref:hypothetical protein n=1 Tax=Dendrosporobacter sp. 1207_IL3150 TaxID=3084054 RepID=UPI002FDA25AB